MPIKFANNAKTTLSSGVSISATSIAVADGSVFPSITASDYFLATLVDSGDNTEIVKVTALSGNTLTVSRAREGTTARSFQSGDKVEVRLTAGGLNDISTTTDLNLSTMTGDGSTATLTLAIAPSTEDNTQVYIDGVYQNKTTYSVSGTTLTFSTAPPTGSEVEVIIINPAAGLSSSTDYATAAQGNKADNALPKSGGAMTGAITTNSTIDGRDVSADGTKLDGIENGATADQTASEIRTLVESASDSNVFTDNHLSKLDGIEANATADQTDAEIETAYNAQVAQVSATEKTAGTVTDARRFSPADIKEMAAVHDTLPIGSFILWGSDTIPTNYLLVNGASLSRSTYSALFGVIGTAFGAADSSHFNLPPTGVFIRITASGSANDPDRASRTASATGGNTGDNVGSFQADEIKSHKHSLNYPNENDENQGFPNNGFDAVWATDRDVASGSGAMLNFGGNETRPVNVNFNLIVKYAA